MYTSRIVGVGMHQGRQFVSFTLTSKSIPYRELRVNEKKRRINVYPRTGFEDHPTNKDPEVDNYACITAGEFRGDIWAISFNGHMCKRTNYNLLEGMSPSMALDLTLMDFRGLPGDARISAIAHSPKPVPRSDRDYREPSFWLGTNDTERREKRIAGYPNERQNTLENTLLFIYDSDTRFGKKLELPNIPMNADSLAEYIHKNIIGRELLFGAATGVAVITSQRGIELGNYTNPITFNDIKRWAEEYEKICGKKINLEVLKF